MRIPSTHWAWGLLILLMVPVGCARSPERQDDSVPPFVFRSLNLRQQDKIGRPTWELTSPEARYDLRRRVARAMSPKGVIYKKGKPAYRIEATSGTVINDGEVILLEGRIRIEQLGDQPVLITATRVRWLPADATMLIDRHPQALDPHTRLVSNQARFLINSKQLELRGKPELQRWSQRFDPFKTIARGSPELVVKVGRADWEPESGYLEARDQVQATRRPAGAPADQSPQTITASALEGNTVREEYVLKGPVLMLDPTENSSLRAPELQIDAKQKRISVDQPFAGQRGSLQVRGQAMVLEGKVDTVTIAAGCELDRPGESLRAQSCAWNWKTQDVRAEGSLVLKREANQQLSRAHRMQGRLGDNGAIELSSPGGRVFSQFRVPPRSGPAKQSQPRPKPEPIRL